MATTGKKKPTAAKKKTAVKPAVKAAAKPAVKTSVGATKLAIKPQAVETQTEKPQTAKPQTAKPQTLKTQGEGATTVAAPVLRKKELIERVVARSGVKKKDAKPTIEAMLAILGEALDNGEELNLHPMGKMKVTRVIEKPNAKVMVTKIRRRIEPTADTVVKITSKT